MSDPVKVLHRSRKNRMIAGVCGGLGEHFGIDPTLVRIVYVVGSILSVAFPGILVYLILWVVIPEEPA
ncbi:MAG TPA: PspC domain-containing protein [Candidatus Aminicenantes bacterium]|nr:PspC domain-containing protein [Candidatus Aminicenantes bacterium]